MQLLTTRWPMPQQRSVPPSQLPPVYILGITFHAMEYPFGQFGSAAPATLPPGFLHTCLLAEHGRLKSPGLRYALLSNNYNISVLSTSFSH